MTQTKTHKKANHIDSKPPLWSGPIDLEPFSPTWFISSLALFFFFIVSIGALAGFFELMQYKYPQNFRYHRENASLSKYTIDPRFNYIPQQFQSAKSTYAPNSCNQPKVQKLDMFDPFKITDFLESQLDSNPIIPIPSPDKDTVIITIR